MKKMALAKTQRRNALNLFASLRLCESLILLLLLLCVRAEAADEKPINFTNQIVPIFTKAGCNSGGCHGKSGGQNGFKLSLLGFEPAEDYEHIVRESRGRRVFPAAPENSLLLLKATNASPHGGGKHLDASSDDYRLLIRWIAEGLPFGKDTDPKLTTIEVQPQQRTMPLGGAQQLTVLAHFTDGSVQDVTRSALYEPNDKNMAKTEENGRVKLFDQPGDVAVMVRYQAKVATFRATIPLGAPVESLPPARNFVDELVFKKPSVSAGVGRRPAISRVTRRMKVASFAGSLGGMPIALSFAKTCSSM